MSYVDALYPIVKERKKAVLRFHQNTRTKVCRNATYLCVPTILVVYED